MQEGGLGVGGGEIKGEKEGSSKHSIRLSDTVSENRMRFASWVLPRPIGFFRKAVCVLVGEGRASSYNRRRQVLKAVYFDESEWVRAQEIMAEGGWGSFSDFAREMILNRTVVVNNRRLDVVGLRAALSPIGNNINQIARKVNTSNLASLEQLEAVRLLLENVEAIVEAYIREGDELGDRENKPD